MDNQVQFEGFDEVEDETLNQETLAETGPESKWDYWHSGFWRIDIDEPCERNIEIEPMLIYEGSFSDIRFQIRFDEQLSNEDLKKHLRVFESWIDEGGIDAIRG